MTDYCEIVEANANAESECPATDNIMVAVSSAHSASTALPVMEHPLVEGTVNAVSQVTFDSYALLTSPAVAQSVLSYTLAVTGLLSSTARGRSSVKAVFSDLATATAEAKSEIAYVDVPMLLVSAAQAASAATGNAVAEFIANSSARARSSTSLSRDEAVESAADAASTVVVLRCVNEMATGQAGAQSEALPTSVPQHVLLLSSGEAASTVVLQIIRQLLLESTAEVSSDVWYKDPGRVAWLMNTETAAASWYDNFDFESIAQPPGKVLAVGADGLYELTGATDAGEQIDASVVSGFTDFKSTQTKRLDAMYFSYTSESRISVTAETYESGHPPSTYFLEQRAADVPRNSRVTPGKGLWGRYWRMTIRNVDGADFEVHDATADVAVSTRRV